MYCARCGAARIDDARYCSKCGTAFEPLDDGEDSYAIPGYEVCHLSAYIVRNTSALQRLLNPYAKDGWCWFAETAGSEGQHTVARSSEFRERFMTGVVPTGPGARSARDEIVAVLLADGWEPVDTDYTEQTYRRRLLT